MQQAQPDLWVLLVELVRLDKMVGLGQQVQQERLVLRASLDLLGLLDQVETLVQLVLLDRLDLLEMEVKVP